MAKLNIMKRIVSSIRPILLSVLCFWVLMPSFASANIIHDAHVEAELISEDAWIQPGKPFWVAVRLKMDEGWHTYWKNPGDSGLATTIEWNLPQGLKAGPIHWPYPEQLKLATLVTYGYENETLLLVEIKANETLSVGSVQKLQAKVDWLACEINCIPGQAKLFVELPVRRDKPVANPGWVQHFKWARERLPLKNSDWIVRAYQSKKDFTFEISPPHDEYASRKKVTFFSYEKDLVEFSGKQNLKTKRNGKLLLKVPRSKLKTENVESISGIFVSEEGWGKEPGSPQAMEVKLKIETRSEGAFLGEVSFPRLIVILFFAFIGGLILNLMPCVLPVLSLKILHFSKYAHEHQRKQTWIHGQFFSLGILLAFWILVTILFILRSGGAEIGWGFQLQSSVFVVILSVMFFLFALNLLGIFEVGSSLTRIGSLKNDSVFASLFNGVLAVVVATPCTAPFMGTAMSVGLTQTNFVAFLVFTFLGLGMAAPYAILTFFPELMRFIPKPGSWMNVFKKVLSVPLFLTVAWLVWVLEQQKGNASLFFLFIGFASIFLSVLILGKNQTNANQSAKGFGYFLFVAGLMISLSAGYLPERVATQNKTATDKEAEVVWHPFSEERLRELRSKGKPVFIDFTAAWCLTCQVNKKFALNHKDVIRVFKEQKVVLLKADWTSRDERITQALAGYGRNSIPFYVYYPPKSEEPVYFPELLTPNIVIKKVKEQTT